MQEHKPQSVPNLYCRTKRRTHEQEDGARKATKQNKDRTNSAQPKHSHTFVTITLPQTSSTRTTHNSTAATSTTREISTQAGTGEKKYARKRKYKNCAAPFFCFHFVLQLRRQQKKACTRENPSKPSKRGEKILNYRTPKKKRSVQHCPREESRRYKTAWTQATAFERQQKSTKRSAKRTGGLFVGGVCAP